MLSRRDLLKATVVALASSIAQVAGGAPTVRRKPVVRHWRGGDNWEPAGLPELGDTVIFDLRTPIEVVTDSRPHRALGRFVFRVQGRIEIPLDGHIRLDPAQFVVSEVPDGPG